MRASIDSDGTVNVSDLLILLGNWGTCDGYPEPSEPPLSISGEMAAAGLTMQAWDDYVDIMTGENERAKANWSCWMENYLSGCTTCPPCPGADPFINY
jgi:hypothetical protein